VRRTIPEFFILEMGGVSAEGVAEALGKLHDDPQRRRHFLLMVYF